jgi:hypothetical protein
VDDGAAAGRQDARGSLLGLAMIGGLVAFFVASATPSGHNPVAAFFLAFAGVLVVVAVPARPHCRLACRGRAGGAEGCPAA